ncbi:MAG: hypothetical protein ABL907_22780 [Hyphomicrobium sp.]
MKPSRKQLQDLAIVLFEEDIEAWSTAGLVSYINDVAAGLDRAKSPKTRSIKNRAKRLLATAHNDPHVVERSNSVKDWIATPSRSAQHDPT